MNNSTFVLLIQGFVLFILKLSRFCLAAGFLLLAACQAAYPLIPPGQTEILAVIQNDGFQPLQWRVAAGKTIRIEVKNESQTTHSWTLLANPLTEPFDGDDQASTIFSITVPPGETRTGAFDSPAAPGKYDVVCITPGHAQQGFLGRLISVQNQK
jgi:plastocyanin